MLERLSQPAVAVNGTPKRTLEKLAGRELNRLVARVKRLGKRPSDDALHSLRIRVKRLRYASELAGATSGKPARRVIAAATQMRPPRRSSGRRRRRGAAADGWVCVRQDGHRLRRRAARGAREVTQGAIHDRFPAAWKDLRKLAGKLAG